MLNPPSLQNNTTIVVNQQNSRKLLMMDILMSETCWAHKKWNKRWLKYDRDCLCVNLAASVPVIFEPPCKIASDTTSSWSFILLLPLRMSALNIFYVDTHIYRCSYKSNFQLICGFCIVVYYAVLCGCPYNIGCVVNCNLYLTCPVLHMWLNGWTNKLN